MLRAAQRVARVDARSRASGFVLPMRRAKAASAALGSASWDRQRSPGKEQRSLLPTMALSGDIPKLFGKYRCVSPVGSPGAAPAAVRRRDGTSMTPLCRCSARPQL